ncbi:hypothetical protein BDR04DRAFT_844159 [Suillus decipiens]|nr:hypothetical protein BDR04DRAFT_844159 [Suillus decipiens]
MLPGKIDCRASSTRSMPVSSEQVVDQPLSLKVHELLRLSWTRGVDLRSHIKTYDHACAVPLLGTSANRAIVEICTISNAMGLILEHEQEKKPCFHTGTGGTGGRFIASAVIPTDVFGSSEGHTVVELMSDVARAQVAGHGVKLLPLSWSPCWEISERSWVEACGCEGKRSVLLVRVSYWH